MELFTSKLNNWKRLEVSPTNLKKYLPANYSVTINTKKKKNPTVLEVSTKKSVAELYFSFIFLYIFYILLFII